MRKAWVVVTVSVMAHVMLAAGTLRSAPFDYTREGVRSIAAVKQEYGDRPVDTIRKVLDDPKADWSIWRRAVAALAFTGSDGAGLLADKLNERLRGGGRRGESQALLDALGMIHDQRAVKLSLAVLQSNVASDLKSQALDVLEKQIKATAFELPPRTVTKSDGTVVYGVFSSGPSLDTSKPIYSSGQMPDRESFLDARTKLQKFLSAMEKQDQVLAARTASIIQLVDAKEHQVQGAVKKWEAENG